MRKTGSFQASCVSCGLLRAGDRHAVYWGCCTRMGADPDPFVRSQILRDASGFFGGIN
jgi:hypothetical protein